MTIKIEKNFSFKKLFRKALIVGLLLLLPFFGFSQSKIEKASETVKIEALSIEVAIDSIEELESIFK